MRISDWSSDVCSSDLLSGAAVRAAVPSPFDYRRQTRVLVVTDVRKDDLGQVAAAYRALFLAAGGGGLGLFTAIGRLRGVHERIAAALEAERSEEHTSELQSLMRLSYAVFCLTKNQTTDSQSHSTTA